jgi:photoactive yellow protein
MSLNTMLETMRETGKAMAKNSFVPEADLARLPHMTREEIDALPYGVIKIEDSGVIQLYNRTQSDFAGYKPREVEGKNFFTELAVCTNNDIFLGTFKKGVTQNDLNVLFNYSFTYKISPTNVRVHMYRDPASRQNFMMIVKR